MENEEKVEKIGSRTAVKHESGLNFKQIAKSRCKHVHTFLLGLGFPSSNALIKIQPSFARGLIPMRLAASGLRAQAVIFSASNNLDSQDGPTPISVR